MLPMLPTGPELPEQELFEKHFRNELRAEELVSQVVDLYLPVLMSYVGRYGVATPEAEPMIQRALLRAVRYALQYKASKSFGAAALMNLRRILFDSSYAPKLIRDIAQGVRENPADSDQAAAVRDFLERKIAVDEMELLLANTVEGRSSAEIAAATNEPEAVVDNRLQRLRARFVQELGLLSNRTETR
jgi:DNA-directed RNA polymerase specialized sigma24 family protein